VYRNSNEIWEQIGSDIDGEPAEDESGWSVSLSSNGSVVAIGTYKNDGNGENSGHVRIYSNNNEVWEQIGSDIDGEAAGDYSGFSNSLSLSSDGNTVAIGAYLNDGNGENSGHVQIYRNNNSVWEQVGSDINGEAAFDHSGVSVSLSSDGTIVAISAPGSRGNNIASVGQVRV
jgi:hypothetical protein